MPRITTEQAEQLTSDSYKNNEAENNAVRSFPVRQTQNT